MLSRATLRYYVDAYLLYAAHAFRFDASYYFSPYARFVISRRHAVYACHAAAAAFTFERQLRRYAVDIRQRAMPLMLITALPRRFAATYELPSHVRRHAMLIACRALLR